MVVGEMYFILCVQVQFGGFVDWEIMYWEGVGQDCGVDCFVGEDLIVIVFLVGFGLCVVEVVGQCMFDCVGFQVFVEYCLQVVYMLVEVEFVVVCGVVGVVFIGVLGGFVVLMVYLL